jgi:hypothetical protein
MVANKDGSSFVEIPGLAEAQRREQELRDQAFLPVCEEIAGVEVRPFTPAHLLALDAMKNGFVVPCIFDRESERVAHAIQFLWVVSPEYKVPSGMAEWIRLDGVRAKFVQRVAGAVGEDVFKGIRSYLADAFYDLNSAGTSSNSPQYFSYVASIIDALCGAGYAWSEEQILSTPFKRLAQYLRASQRRLKPDGALANPSDKISVDYISEMNQRAKRHG